VSCEFHRNEAVVGSYDPSMGVQRQRASIVDQNWPLDYDSDGSSRRYVVCGRYEHAVAADVHRSGPALYLLLPSDGITGVKRDGKANSASTFRSVEGTQALPCLFHNPSAWARRRQDDLHTTGGQ
jgi:hypothetical protein